MTTAAVPALHVRAFWAPKAGNADDEWEDGAAASVRRGRVAVADGASASVDAARWAGHLVRSWIVFDADAGTDFGSWLASTVESYEPTEVTDDASWFASAAAGRAAFATFVGLGFEGFEARVWAVGDTVAFLVRGEQVVGAVPALGPEDFGTTPDLVGSEASLAAGVVDGAIEGRMACSPGDVVVVATDAVAEWIVAVDPRSVATLVDRLDQPTFRRLVDELRARGEMVNDDCTLVRIRVGELAA